jgi:hypothetical protein
MMQWNPRQNLEKKNTTQNMQHVPYVFNKNNNLAGSTWTWQEIHLTEEQPYV